MWSSVTTPRSLSAFKRRARTLASLCFAAQSAAAAAFRLLKLIVLQKASVTVVANRVRVHANANWHFLYHAH